MRRALQMLAIALLALVLQPFDIASGAGRAWTAASCKKVCWELESAQWFAALEEAAGPSCYREGAPGGLASP
jgi:hypothetical protein